MYWRKVITELDVAVIDYDHVMFNWSRDPDYDTIIQIYEIRYSEVMQNKANEANAAAETQDW